MLFYNTIVFPYDWVVVFYDNEKHKHFSIINKLEDVKLFYNNHKDEIWCGYNSRQYGQYAIKSILCDMNPYNVYQYIKSGKQGFSYTKKFNNFPIINYDVIQGIDKSLDVVKGFMGENINSISNFIKADGKWTEEEKEIARKLCLSDTYIIARIFEEKISQFNAMMTLVKHFNLPLSDIGKTEASITAKILGCTKTQRTDESQFSIEKYININKYSKVLQFYQSLIGMDTKRLYKKKLEYTVADVPHKFGWGGIHGAKEKYTFQQDGTRRCWHIDVTSYYPSYLIAHNRITRSAKYPSKYVWAYEHQIELKHQGRKSERLPFKKMLNALSGAMKDKYNPAYDPCMNNTMVVNCQLSTLMLLESLEEIEGFELIQSNTDGLIVVIPNTKQCEYDMYAKCHMWEFLCSTYIATIKLDFEEIEWLVQKDVNNYIFKFVDSDKIERKGTYLKKLSLTDYNTPILNEAIVAYIVNGDDVEETIYNCTDYKKFQIIREISNKFSHFVVNGNPINEKCIRIFASNRLTDNTIYKIHSEPQSPIKVEGTPMNAFVDNSNINNKEIPEYLDRDWYVKEAKSRLLSFGFKY